LVRILTAHSLEGEVITHAVVVFRAELAGNLNGPLKLAQRLVVSRPVLAATGDLQLDLANRGDSDARGALDRLTVLAVVVRVTAVDLSELPRTDPF
jgi:hypothetical protein